MHRFGYAWMALILVLGLVGCRTSRPGPHPDALPLSPQSSERHQCGPSTLASVLAYNGVAIPEETISEAIYSPTARGVLFTDLAWYAREQGFHAELREGGLDDLKNEVNDRKPPIVLLDLGVAGIRKPHFTAVTGVTDGGVLFLGHSRADEYSPIKLFLRQWKRAGNQYLVIVSSCTSQP